MPSVDPTVCSRNIAALRARQPQVASVIESATGPQARLVAGRDGSPTFLIESESPGAPAWLGDSSMPSVSAEEMFRGFLGGHENVFVPGILAGREVLRLAQRFSRHAAIFVVERCAYHLQLALRLCDFSGLIERGQIVFLLESDFESQLLSLFQRFPGYLLPSRMLTIPHRSALEHAELQRRIERAGVQLVRHQADVLAGLQTRLAGQAMPHKEHRERTGEIREESPRRVAVLSTDASDDTREDGRRLSGALRELGCPHACCVPDRPEHCHPVARLRCMEEIAANCVILVNSPPRALRTLMPEGMPIIFWYFASARVPAALESSHSPGDLFAVTSKAQQAQLASAGVPEQQVCYAGITVAPLAHGEPPALAGAEFPVPEPIKIANADWGSVELAGTGSARIGENKRPSRGSPFFDALVAADVPDDRPEAAGIGMSTHAALWRECVKIAADQVVKSKVTQGAEILTLAEKRNGAKLSDAKIRGEMIQKIEERVLPASFARHLGRQLNDRFKVAFAGANWPQNQESTARSRTADTAVAHVHSSTADTAVAHARFSNAIALTGDLLSKATHARWIILPFFSTTAIQSAVDILAAGGCVALRAGRTPLAEAHPELRDLAKFIPTFTNVRQAVEIVSQGPSGSRDEVGAALEKLSLNVVLPRVLKAADLSPRAHDVLGAASPA